MYNGGKQDMTPSIQRIFIAVLDGVGAGELPDADLYGDTGSNTLSNTASAVGGLKMPNMGKLGLGIITPIAGVPPKLHLPVATAKCSRLRPAKIR